MKILSLETTSEVCSVAILENGNVICELLFESPDVAGQLIAGIEVVLKKSGFPLSSIDYFVVSSGPGSWTGTRTGLSLVKGLARGERKTIYAVSSPQSFFFGLRHLKLPAICLINAYSGKMYITYFNGRFYYKKDYLPEKMDYGKINEACAAREAILTGPGVMILPEKIKKFRNIKIPDRYFLYPRAGINGLLAVEKIRKNIPSLPLNPYYGR
jgi:tRNA threonylcarbamoyladenosine biosynthesis protein TsaB